MTTKNKNPYMIMSLERVRQDAIHGVSLARQALRIRSPEQAKALGLGVEPGHQSRVKDAVRGFYDSRRTRLNNDKCNI